MNLSMLIPSIKYANQFILPVFNNGKFPKIYPYQLQVDLTRFCAHWFKYKKRNSFPPDCIQCACPRKTDDFLPIDQLKDLLTNFEAYSGKSLYLTGGGEPGNYPFLKELFHFLANSNLILTLNTNGDFINKIFTFDPFLLKQVFSKNKQPSLISISIHEKRIYSTVRMLYNLKNDHNLNIIIRTVSMIHSNTKENEIFEFIKQSIKNRADIASFRPYYINVKGKREYVKNENIYKKVISLMNEKHKISIQASKIDRITRNYKYIHRMFNPENFICLSPLYHIYYNTDLFQGMCCDTKELGIGGIPEIFLGSGNLINPSEYYIQALTGIVTLDFSSCIIGCSFIDMYDQDQETQWTDLIHILKDLRHLYFKNFLSKKEIEKELLQQFKEII